MIHNKIFIKLKGKGQIWRLCLAFNQVFHWHSPPFPNPAAPCKDIHRAKVKCCCYHLIVKFLEDEMLGMAMRYAGSCISHSCASSARSNLLEQACLSLWDRSVNVTCCISAGVPSRRQSTIERVHAHSLQTPLPASSLGRVPCDSQSSTFLKAQ